jgi:hypothetical protein
MPLFIPIQADKLAPKRAKKHRPCQFCKVLSIPTKNWPAMGGIWITLITVKSMPIDLSWWKFNVSSKLAAYSKQEGNIEPRIAMTYTACKILYCMSQFPPQSFAIKQAGITF